MILNKGREALSARMGLTLAAAAVCGIAASAIPASAAGWTTSGTKILNPANGQYLINSIAWYGAETSSSIPNGLYHHDYTYIVDTAKKYGSNTLRIPFSNAMWETDPAPNSNTLSLCPTCKGKHSRDILAMIINYAGSIGMHVVLDNHRSEAGNSAEASGLWYTSAYPESAWINDWVNIQHWVHGIMQTQGSADTIKLNYLASDGFPIVIGFDIRNEPFMAQSRSGTISGSQWGAGDGISPSVNPNPNPFTITASAPRDWRLAAERCGDKILGDAAANGWSNPIIIVEGTSTVPTATGNWTSGPWDWAWNGGNIMGINGNAGNPGAPIVLNAGGSVSGLGPSVANQVVYSPHDYGPNLYPQPWFNANTTYKHGSGPSSLADFWNKFWAFACQAGGINPVWPGHSSYPWANTGATAYSSAPIWVGEFGTGNTAADISSTVRGSQGQWFMDLVNFIQSSTAKTTANDSGFPIADITYSYWALNGNDPYALLDSGFTQLAFPAKDYSALCDIQATADPLCGSTGPLPAPF